MDALQTYFAQHAKEILKERGFNQATFAEAMGIARQNVGKVVFNSNNIQMLSKAADLLGVSLFYLIGGEVEAKPKVNGFVEIDGRVHRITTKEQLIALAESLKNKLEEVGEE